MLSLALGMDGVEEEAMDGNLTAAYMPSTLSTRPKRDKEKKMVRITVK